MGREDDRGRTPQTTRSGPSSREVSLVGAHPGPGGPYRQGKGAFISTPRASKRISIRRS